MKEEERRRIDDLILTKRDEKGKAEGPPAWWKGEAEAARNNLAMLKVNRASGNGKG